MDDEIKIENKRMDIFILSFVAVLGTFMGIYFVPVFLLSKNNTLLWWNIASLICGIATGFYLYYFTGKISELKKTSGSRGKRR